MFFVGTQGKTFKTEAGADGWFASEPKETLSPLKRI
jgi:hypothetical protein